MAAPAVAAAGAARAAGLAWQQRRLLGWLLAWLLGIPLAVALLVVVLLNGTGTSAGAGAFRPSALALRDIPALFLGLYQAAGMEYGLGWEYLAAIGKIETDHGRSRAAGVRSGVNVAGCCAGPMQFSITGPRGGTWGAYGVDADHDGHRDVYDPPDAIAAAAKYLQASGAPKDWDRALYAYNHAGWYVAQVERQAQLYRGEPVAGAGGLRGMGSADAAALARNAKITFSHPGPELEDLRSGRISPRLVSLLALITEQHTIGVFALASDHRPGSNHEAGRGVDIWMVDGDNCYPPDREGGCWALAQQLDQLRGCLHPTELIYYYDPGPGAASFAKADHDDHIHVGYDGPLGARTYRPGVAPCSAAALTGGGAR